MAYLVLVRHGLSTYNEKGLWTGWADPPLSERGKEESRNAAETIKDINFDFGYTSPLIRAKETLSLMLKILGGENLPTFVNKALNERNYGIYSGKNKWDIQKQVGEEEFTKLRRSFDYPIPDGESLREVYERVIPYYQTEILPKLQAGKNILISSSHNALRALVKYLENIADDDIPKVEIGTGEVWVYSVSDKGEVIQKEIRLSNPKKV